MTLRPEGAVEGALERQDSSTSQARGIRFAISLAVALMGLVFAAPSMARTVTLAEVVNHTDWTQAGIAGVGDSASVNIALSGVSGTVKKAYLYYHGNGDPAYAPIGVTFAGVPVNPVSLGNAPRYCNYPGSSTTYWADVTAQVTGNGTYAVANLANGGAEMDADGASLIVFYDDSNAANDRDVALFEGNDANYAFGYPGETDGWQLTLPNIHYTTGIASASFHASGGSHGAMGPDEDLVFTATPDSGGTNPLTIEDTGLLWDGRSLPAHRPGPFGLGDSYDMHRFDITALFNSVPATYTVNLDTNFDDVIEGNCKKIALAILAFKAGALPQEICGNGIDDDGDGQVDEDCGPATINTTLTSGPSSWWVSKTATFAFSSSEPGTFQCRFDAATTYTACSSPKSYTNLVAGDHVLRIRAVDRAGKPDATPLVRAWVTPADDRVLTRSAGWSALSSTLYFAGTYVSSTTKDATLTRTGVTAKRLALVATRCPTCGIVQVLWNGTLVQQIGLASSTTARKQVIALPAFGALRTGGTIVIKVVSSTGKVVEIDALGISKG
jgi:hypothetical protein